MTFYVIIQSVDLDHVRLHDVDFLYFQANRELQATLRNSGKKNR